MSIRIARLAALMLLFGGLAACEATHRPSPYEGTFIYRGGGP